MEPKGMRSTTLKIVNSLEMDKLKHHQKMSDTPLSEKKNLQENLKVW